VAGDHPDNPGFIVMILNKKAAKRVLDISWYTTKEKILAWLCVPGYYGVMLYSIVVPLKLGTMWFYTGLVIYVAGFVPLIIAYFNNAATPAGAVAFLVAQMLFLPCVATMGVMYSESKSFKLVIGMVAYMGFLSFALAILSYQILRL
jgi:Fe2+ transport system protein B